MAFNVKIDGKTVHEVDIDPRLVVSVSLRTAAGEAGIAGSPFSGEGNDYVNLVLICQQPTALPVVEDDARLAAQEEGPEEILTYNENAQREAALAEVDAEYAEKSTGTEEDLSNEYNAARAAALDPDQREEVAPTEEVAPEENPTQEESDLSL
jgi:hypothetical protein